MLLSEAVNWGLSLSSFQRCKFDKVFLITFFCKLSGLCEFREKMKKAVFKTDAFMLELLLDMFLASLA